MPSIWRINMYIYYCVIAYLKLNIKFQKSNHHVGVGRKICPRFPQKNICSVHRVISVRKYLHFEMVLKCTCEAGENTFLPTKYIPRFF